MTTSVFQLGKNVRFYVGDGASGTENYLPIGGEKEIQVTVQADDIDTTSKDSGSFKTSLSGQMKVTLKVSGNVFLPDAGYTRVAEQAATSGNMTDFKVMRGSIVLIMGTCALMNHSVTGSENGAESYSFDAALTAAPTTFNLAATS